MPFNTSLILRHVIFNVAIMHNKNDTFVTVSQVKEVITHIKAIQLT
jgi:hypothetical protein